MRKKSAFKYFSSVFKNKPFLLNKPQQKWKYVSIVFKVKHNPPLFDHFFAFYMKWKFIQNRSTRRRNDKSVNSPFQSTAFFRFQICISNYLCRQTILPYNPLPKKILLSIFPSQNPQILYSTPNSTSVNECWNEKKKKKNCVKGKHRAKND